MATLPLHWGDATLMVSSSGLPGSAHPMCPMDFQSLEPGATPRPGGRAVGSTLAGVSPEVAYDFMHAQKPTEEMELGAEDVGEWRGQRRMLGSGGDSVGCGGCGCWA